MQIKISLQPEDKEYLELPLNYNYLIQSAIYKNIFPELAGFLHNQGFKYEKRTFKMFSFSRILGPFKINKGKGKITFQKPEFVITTPIQELTQSVGNFILKDRLRLGDAYVAVTNVEVRKQKVEHEMIVLQALSPITVYSTAILADGRKYTIYYGPEDKYFESIIDGNLRKKYCALNGKEVFEESVKLEKLSNARLNVVKFKGTIIKGYTFKLRLKGPKELLQLAVDTGLGSKNSQGFGCVELVEQ
ncbi:MAG: CRISPR-associated endoribonuclease Cas6 [Clostridia bacterium]|nr:CRISPR-associated endoribonuclease Cas6 [Clostridia bacterium]